jgi:uncharacterized protein (TIGR02996 family)
VQAAALEQTLRDHPDDLAAWRAYGEWLVERGDARGELIRLEQRHARTRAAGCHSCINDAHPARASRCPKPVEGPPLLD